MFGMEVRLVFARIPINIRKLPYKVACISGNMMNHYI